MHKHIEHTVWIDTTPSGGFVAYNYRGTVLMTNKHKSTLEYMLRQAILKQELDMWAIATVIKPSDRLDRGINRRKR